ncbi:MAG: glycosyltransferase [Phycisphaerae bacterium]|nr:glycosyltransferase [Phycisphaerae bacterium]
MKTWLESILAQALVTIILTVTMAATALGSRVRAWFCKAGARTVADRDGIDVVMAGTFYNGGWFRSHVMPLVHCNRVRRILVVCDQPLDAIDKVVYRTPSPFLMRVLGRTLARFLMLMRVARTARPQLLMGYHIMPNALMCLVAARWFGVLAAYQMTGGPVQVIGGGIGSENTLLRRQRRFSAFRERLMIRLVRAFDLVIVRGQSAAEYINSIGAGDRCRIIPGSIADRFAEPHNSPRPVDDAIDLIAVGRLVDVKRYDRLLNIVARLRHIIPGVRVAIVGDGPEESKLRDHASRLGISQHIVFMGKRDDVDRLLPSARAFIMTSENEGLSIAMMEAMAAGLPAIVPAVGELGDLVRDGETGIIINPEETDATAEKIASLLNNADLLKKLSRRAPQTALAHASVPAVARRWCDSFDSLDGYDRSVCANPSQPRRSAPADVPVVAPESTLRRLTLITTVALAVRLLFCFVAVPSLNLRTGPSQPDFYSSTDGYVQIARTLIEHGKYAFSADAPPTTYRAPMFPFALAAVYALLGDIGTAVLLVNCLVSALTCAFVFLIAKRFVGERAGFMLTVPAIFFPLSIYYCTSGFSDTFFAFAVSLYALTLLRLVQRPTAANGFLHGLAFAFAALTKAVILPIPFIIGAYLIVRTKLRGASEMRQSLRAGLIKHLVTAICVATAFISIWTARNLVVANQLILITGGTGYNALIGNFMIEEWSDCDTSLAYGRARAIEYVRKTHGAAIYNHQLRPTNYLDVPADIDHLYGRAALDMMFDSPFLMFRKLAVNSVRFWYFSSGALKSVANGVVNGVLLLFGIIALPGLHRNRGLETEIFGLFVFAFVVLYSMIIVHSSRFCLPMVMLIAPAASIGAARLTTWLRPASRIGAAAAFG